MTTHKYRMFNYRPISLVVRVFNNGAGDQGSIPGRVIPKTPKMVLDATLLNTQHYEVRIKGKVEQSREWSSAQLRLPSLLTTAFVWLGLLMLGTFLFSKNEIENKKAFQKLKEIKWLIYIQKISKFDEKLKKEIKQWKKPFDE